MANKLITFKKIEEMYKDGVRKINLSQDIILSPSAKDFALERGIQLSYENKEVKQSPVPEPANDPEEKLKESIVRILKQEFMIVERERIEEITTSVMKFFKNKH